MSSFLSRRTRSATPACAHHAMWSRLPWMLLFASCASAIVLDAPSQSLQCRFDSTASERNVHGSAVLIHGSTDGREHKMALEEIMQLRGGDTMSVFKQWAYKCLAKMGIFMKSGKLLVLGLDNAGKSTLLTVLLRDEVVPTAPTHQPVTDVIKVGHMKLRAVDMGGHEIARRMWLQYSRDADGVVYIVDSVDRERFPIAALELHKLLAANALPAGAPVLVLGNKVDLPAAAREEELYYGLGLDEIYKSGQRPLRLFMCSVFERRGFMEGFEWLSKQIK